MDSLNNNIKSMEYSIKQFYKHNAYYLSISDMKFPNGALFTHKGASQCRYNNISNITGKYQNLFGIDFSSQFPALSHI